MRVSFVTTVFNEEKTIEKLLDSLFKQTRMPNEIVIVDGGSSDHTVAKIKNQKSKIKSSVKFKFIIKQGNRAVGRNEAIRNATGDIITCSDAGCILDEDWVKNITAPFKDKKIDVVAGYYKGLADTVFQKCLVPYVLVMEDRVDYNNFLPASRSMAFKKSVWEKAEGFPEDFSFNEDYVFAKKLKKIKAKIVFQKDAIVLWIPRKNLSESFIMFYKFAYGDSQAGILRPKGLLVLFRYLVGLILGTYFFLSGSNIIFIMLSISVILYLLWSVLKNYSYVNDFRAIFILPVLQIISDIAVIIGMLLGITSMKSRSSISKIRKI